LGKKANLGWLFYLFLIVSVQFRLVLFFESEGRRKRGDEDKMKRGRASSFFTSLWFVWPSLKEGREKKPEIK